MERSYGEEIHKRTNHVLRKGTCVQRERSDRCNQNRVNMFGNQRVSSHTVGESFFFWRATFKSTGRTCGNEIEVQTTLLNTYPPELIATIQKALGAQLEEHDQFNAVEEIAGPAPETN